VRPLRCGQSGAATLLTTCGRCAAVRVAPLRSWQRAAAALRSERRRYAPDNVPPLRCRQSGAATLLTTCGRCAAVRVAPLRAW